MSYAAGRIIYDADSHVMETREWMDPFMDAELKRSCARSTDTSRTASTDCSIRQKLAKATQKLKRMRCRTRSKDQKAGSPQAHSIPTSALGCSISSVSPVNWSSARQRLVPFARRTTKAFSMRGPALTTRQWLRSAGTTRACTVWHTRRSKTRCAHSRK